MYYKATWTRNGEQLAGTTCGTANREAQITQAERVTTFSAVETMAALCCKQLFAAVMLKPPLYESFKSFKGNFLKKKQKKHT